MDPAEQRFAQLLGLVLDGVCSDDEQEDLAQLAEEHPHLIVAQVETIFTHSLLLWQCEDVSEFMALELAASAQDDSIAVSAATPVRHRAAPLGVGRGGRSVRRGWGRCLASIPQYDGGRSHHCRDCRSKRCYLDRWFHGIER